MTKKPTLITKTLKAKEHNYALSSSVETFIISLFTPSLVVLAVTYIEYWVNLYRPTNSVSKVIEFTVTFFRELVKYVSFSMK